MRSRLPLALAVLLALAAAWFLRPPAPVRAPAVRPAGSYAEAIDRLAVQLERDTLELSAGCGTLALLAGGPTPRAFVLLHGITNCPLQFEMLAESLRAGGDNVLVPRLDHHGLYDRMTTDLANLRAEEVAALVTESVGIARGLGDTVVVCGLSTSGVAAAWAATRVPGVARAVVIAPAFAPPWQPAWLATLAGRAALRARNVFVWWDDKLEEDLPGPRQCYPRFATRAMGEAYRLGEDVMRALARRGPLAHDVAIVTTAGDHAIDNGRARRFAERCAVPGVRVRRHVFAAADSVVHDMIDPVQVGANTDLVYPVLLRFLRGQPALAAPAGTTP